MEALLWWQAQKPQALHAWGFCTSKGETMAGRTTRRGYGAAHQRLRRRVKAELEAFDKVPCYRCAQPIYANQPHRPPAPHVKTCRSPKCPGTCWSTWDLDHTDERMAPDGTPLYGGPSHSACNRGAANGNPLYATKPAISRSW